MTVKKISYRCTDPRLPKPPSEGSLFATQRGADKIHLPNGSTQEIDCGVSLTLPAGVTVEITPDPLWERTGVRGVSQRLTGPLKGHPVFVTLFNHAGGTIRLTNGEEVAQICAYESPPQAQWVDAQPEPEPEPEPSQTKKETLGLKKPLIDPAHADTKAAV